MLYLLALLAAPSANPSMEAVTEPEDEAIPLSVMIFPTVGTAGTLRDPPATKNVNLSLVAGYATRVHGIDLAGGFAWIEEELRGIQLGGGALVEGETHGVQLASTFAWTSGDLHGLQVGSIVNYAGGGNGMQAGLLNLTGRFDGMQLGVVNVAEHLDGLPLGLINVIGDGIHDFGFVVSDVGLAGLALDLGNQTFYTRWTASVASAGSSRTWIFGGGGGLRMRLDPAFIDLAFLARDVIADFRADLSQSTSHSALFTVELAAGWTFGDSCVRAGPTFNVYRAKSSNDPFVPRWADPFDDQRTWAWIGFTAGASL